VPGLCLLLSAAVAVSWRPAVRALPGLFALVLAGEGYAAYMLQAHGTTFAHGPHARLAEKIRALGVEDLSVVHDGSIGIAYFPLHFELAGKLRQYVVQAGAAPHSPNQPIALSRILPSGLEPAGSIAELPTRHVLVLQPRWEAADDLRNELEGHGAPFEPSPAAEALEQAGARKLETERIIATASALVHVFEH
jgi:hypothetical protein